MDDNTKLAVIEGQISNFDKYLEKIDTTLDKLTEVSSSMEKMLAVQETRLNAQDEADKVLKDLGLIGAALTWAGIADRSNDSLQ